MFSVVSILAAGACLSGMVSAQMSGNQSTNYRYNVDPNTIDPTTRSSYCTSQNNVCRLLCYEGTVPGTPYCDPDTLVWNCECRGSPTPDLTTFNGTIPFFECTVYKEQCVANTDSANEQMQCLAIECGGRDAQDYYDSQTGSGPSGGSGGGSNGGSNNGGGNGGSGSGGSGGNSNGGGPSNGGSNGGSQGSAGSGNGDSGTGGGEDDMDGAAKALSLGSSYGMAIWLTCSMALFGLAL